MQTMAEVTEAETEEGRQLPESVAALGRLAENYWWSWAADGPGVFRDLDPLLGAVVRPVVADLRQRDVEAALHGQHVRPPS